MDSIFSCLIWKNFSWGLSFSHCWITNVCVFQMYLCNFWSLTEYILGGFLLRQTSDQSDGSVYRKTGRLHRCSALLKDDDNNDAWVEELKQPGSDGDGENNQTDRGSWTSPLLPSSLLPLFAMTTSELSMRINVFNLLLKHSRAWQFVGPRLNISSMAGKNDCCWSCSMQAADDFIGTDQVMDD